MCTGWLLLGAAGLLKGHRAKSHWTTRALLPLVGATAVDERVVQDLNRITGAGVSAGLDLGLTGVGLLRDRTYAETVQLLADYAPHPRNKGKFIATLVAQRDAKTLSVRFDNMA